MENTLTALSDNLAAVVERAGQFVVGVQGHPRVPSSGVLWQAGVAVTSDHTLRRDDEIRVTLPSGKTVTAQLAGRDPGTDLAVLKVDSGGIEPGKSSNLKPGTLVLAVGRSPEARTGAAMGIVSVVGPAWSTWRGGRIDQFVRLDLRLYPGASGGAVVDAAGNLLGIATGGLSRTSAILIPATTVNRISKELLEKGHVARGYLGVGLQPVSLPEHLKRSANLAQNSGLIVLSVEPGAPADQAGLAIGDVLVALDSKPVTDTDDVQAALALEAAGKTLRAAVVRGGALKEMPVVVGERPRRRE